MDAADKIVNDAEFRIRYLQKTALALIEDATEVAIEHGDGELGDDVLCVAQMMLEQIQPLLPELVEAILKRRSENVKSS